MMKTVQLKIGNMVCAHCQETIENALKRKNGIVSAEASYRTGNAEISFDEKIINIEEIISIIQKLDYTIVTESSEKRNNLKNIFILFAIILIYGILNTPGIFNSLAQGQLADENMSYGMLFIIGLFTSVHCIAMCGGINLSQSLSAHKGTFFKSSLFYNLGRLVSYTFFGFILGLAGFVFGGGSRFEISYILQGIIKILTGFLISIMGINMLGIFPFLRRLTAEFPKFISKKIGRKKHKAKTPPVFLAREISVR